jgi:hypothetical protein
MRKDEIKSDEVKNWLRVQVGTNQSASGSVGLSWDNNSTLCLGPHAEQTTINVNNTTSSQPHLPLQRPNLVQHCLQRLLLYGHFVASPISTLKFKSPALPSSEYMPSVTVKSSPTAASPSSMSMTECENKQDVTKEIYILPPSQSNRLGQFHAIR